MTGFESKRQAAKAKLDDEADTLTIVYQQGFADGKRAAQPEQEPVAYFDFQQHKFTWAKHMKIGPVPVTIKVEPMALYTTPPAAQRPWQGLTDEEMLDATYKAGGILSACRKVEAKLKERNT